MRSRSSRLREAYPKPLAWDAAVDALCTGASSSPNPAARRHRFVTLGWWVDYGKRSTLSAMRL
jgi:hypothetical protein